MGKRLAAPKGPIKGADRPGALPTIPGHPGRHARTIPPPPGAPHPLGGIPQPGKHDQTILVRPSS